MYGVVGFESCGCVPLYSVPERSSVLAAFVPTPTGCVEDEDERGFGYTDYMQIMTVHRACRR